MKKLFPIFIFLLSSCAVMQEEYFLPQAEGARTEKESCRGQVGADNRLVYEFDKVNLRLNVWENEGKTYLSVSLRVFENGIAVWPAQTINIYTDDKKVPYSPESFSRLRSKPNGLTQKEYKVGSEMDFTTKTEYETYNTYLMISDKPSKQIKVELLKVLVNGNVQILENMTFTKTKGIFLHPLNC